MAGVEGTVRERTKRGEAASKASEAKIKFVLFSESNKKPLGVF